MTALHDLAAERVAGAFVERLVKTWVCGDLDLLPQIFAANAVYYRDPTARPIRGIAALRKHWRSTHEPGGNVSIQAREPLVAGRLVVAELWRSIAVGGDDQQAAAVCLIAILDRDQRCSELREYWMFAGRESAPDWRPRFVYTPDDCP